MAYAEGTRVSVERSQDEIRALLAKHGCKSFALFSGENTHAIQFMMAGLPYRFVVHRPTLDEIKKAYIERGGVAYRVSDWASKIEAEWRRRWRARLLWIKATLEFAAGEGDEGFIAQALMANLVLPDDQSAGEWLGKQLPGIYGTGRLPALPMHDS